jgi:hypothetical protein
MITSIDLHGPNQGMLTPVVVKIKDKYPNVQVYYKEDTVVRVIVYGLFSHLDELDAAQDEINEMIKDEGLCGN